ncbi:hypothetical protein [Staphylococcus sp. GDK8D30P]|uniref:hypothetical protein n=1 Tax=Staphylococcus sp. GDK8D30P TaxID=2804090 RepID=UPI001AEC3A41|nr:hypothetical protein [Staphylococcus sp. GDK8D30P]
MHLLDLTLTGSRVNGSGWITTHTVSVVVYPSTGIGSITVTQLVSSVTTGATVISSGVTETHLLPM